MRYKEAYETVRFALKKHKLSFPITENILNDYFDSNVETLGLRLVRVTDTETWTTVAEQLDYIATNSNFTNKHIKLHTNSKHIPFIPHNSAPVPDSNLSNEFQDYKIGYYFKKEITSKDVTGATSADPIVFTSTAHGLTTGDYVRMSEIVGLLSASGALSEVNGNRFAVTRVDDDSFSIDVDGSGYAVAYTSGGIFKMENDVIKLTKSISGGDVLSYDYFAKPLPRNSLVSWIDLPDKLVTASIQHVMADLLQLDGFFQIGSGHRGVARKREAEYTSGDRTREPMPAMVSQPMNILS